MRTALGLYAFAVLVRLVLIALYPDPAYVDSYYYVNVARALQAGHGFNIDFIWTFVDLGGSIPARPVLPIPSNAHWMPLASLVQVPFLAILGPTAWASALPFALIGSLAAPMTWAFATEAGARRNVAIGAGLLIALPAAVVFMAQPDNFSLFQPIVLGALWLGARGLKGDARAFGPPVSWWAWPCSPGTTASWSGRPWDSSSCGSATGPGAGPGPRPCRGGRPSHRWDCSSW